MKQTLITLIENKPGVLHRIASLFRRRNFNIESVVAGSSETPGITRMTIITNEMDRQKRGNIYYNLLNLVNVVAVKDVSDLPCVTREFILIKLESDLGQFRELNRLVKKFGARIVDKGSETIILEATDEKDIIDELVDALNPFNITEIMRTGKISMRKGRTHNVLSETISANANQEKWQPEQIDTYQ